MIGIDFLEFATKTDFDVDEFIQFKKEMFGLRGSLKTSHFYDVNSISKFTKNRNEIIDFLTHYEKLIETFVKTDTLDYALTLSEYELEYHTDEYKMVIMEIRRVGEEKTRLLIEKLKEIGCKKFNFGKETLKDKYYENCRQKYNSNLCELTYYFTDGIKEYLSTYSGTTYPIVIKDANILIEHRDANIFHNGTDVYIFSFDIDFDKIPKDWSNKSIVEKIPFNEIKKITDMCWVLRNIDKTLESMNETVKKIGNLRTYDEFNELYKMQLNLLIKQIDTLNDNRQTIIEEYIELGYSQEYIQKCLEHLVQAEENAKIDYC